MRNLTLEDIRTALQKPLPGLAAQIKLAPEFRVESLRATPPVDARTAGVLILLYPHNGVWYFPLIKRAEDGLTHGGQISLPGGSQEAGESLQETARREACEEIGAACADVEVLGQLSTIYIPPSNFLVTPTVGYADQRPDFRCDPREVAELIEVPLSTLFDRACGETRTVDAARHNRGSAVLSNRAAQSVGRDGDDPQRVQFSARRIEFFHDRQSLNSQTPSINRCTG